ncbi:hypothetical protein T484DRAFT_1826369 [Baffinella frigidus]|nr:hypothetical protein T484DRAFT_1826369 [Cryptophyta sp. CCMP2293]
MGGLVVSGGGPDVRVWDSKTGGQTGTLKGHQHYISSLDFDAERRLITDSISMLSGASLLVSTVC